MSVIKTCWISDYSPLVGYARINCSNGRFEDTCVSNIVPARDVAIRYIDGYWMVFAGSMCVVVEELRTNLCQDFIDKAKAHPLPQF